MDWKLTKIAYYADFVTAPLAVLLALAFAPLGWPTVAGAFAGLAGWTFIEYALHRWVFHSIYRREHWAHHQKPARYIGVPPWQTGLAFVAAYVGSTWIAGAAWGTGIFTGLMVGYWLYIAVHDRIHHAANPAALGGYARRHTMHHKGFEGNFGVISTVWDRLLGTYRAA